MKFLQYGFSLIESLVAAGIAALLLTGLFTLYLNNQHSYAIAETLATLQDNGRYALNLITREVRRAGYFGGMININAVTGTSGPSPAQPTCPTQSTTWGRMLSQPIFGLDETRSGYDCISGSSHSGSYSQGDIVAIRYAMPVNAITDPQRLYLRTAFATGRLFAGNLAHHPANVIASNASNHELTANAFYVGKTQRYCGNQKTPALFRKKLNNHGVPETEEMVSGIEDLQLQYGLDANADGNVDYYGDANAISQWQQVVAARLWVLVRAECPEIDYKNSHQYALGNKILTPQDNFRRQLHSTTIVLRNRAIQGR